MHRFLGARRLAALALALLWSANACDGGPTEPSTPVALIEVAGTPAQNVLAVGATAQLSATVLDAGGATLERRVTWTSSNSTVARVSSSGLVTAVSSGVALIRAATGGQTAEVPIAVLVSVPVPAAGASSPTTTSLFGNTLSISVPPGAVSGSSLLVGRAAVTSDDPRILTTTAFAVSPLDAAFASPITAEVVVNLTGLSTSKRLGLRLYRVTGTDDLEPIVASALDATRGVVVAPITRGGVYVVVVPGDAAQLAAAEGASRRVPVNTAVPGVAVIARDALGRPVPGVPVEFSPEGTGNGSIIGDTIAVTDIEGRAELPGQWIPGATTGTYFLRASVLGTPLSVRFTGLTFVPAVAVRFTSAPDSALSGVMITDPFVIELVDGEGNRADVTQDVALSFIGPGAVTGPITGTAAGGGLITQGQTISGAGTWRVVVSSAGLLPDTTEIVVTQRVRALRMITQPSANATSLAPFATQPVVELIDDAGVRVVSGTNRVSASTLTGALLGTTTVTAVEGVATFTDLAIEGEGSTSLVFNSVEWYYDASNLVSNTIDVAPFQGILLRVGQVPLNSLAVGQTWAPAFQFDMSNRGGANVAALDVTFTWDPTKLSYLGRNPEFWRDTNFVAASVTVDDSRVAEGILRFTGSTPGPTTSNFDLGGVMIQALPTTTQVQTTITAVVNSATNAASAPVPITVRPVTITIYPAP